YIIELAQKMNNGELEVEFCAQGILAERIRAGGAGISAILTDIGVGTELAKNKQIIYYKDGPKLIESALRADFALLHCAKADHIGNLVYAAAARNFNPLMAMAAKKVFVEAEEIVSLGKLAPTQIHTVGSFVDGIVELSELSGEYDVVRR
ncbi:MAG: 3-oxoacid CoA-transferase subunit A, partial [Alphaproteobacteria bacterium]|nr:3-oxoacid CoA-transferase subunit A [Alphaproteobacteria bacterium]